MKIIATSLNKVIMCSHIETQTLTCVPQKGIIDTCIIISKLLTYFTVSDVPLFLVVCFCFSRQNLSVCSSGYPGTHFVGYAGLELTKINLRFIFLYFSFLKTRLYACRKPFCVFLLNIFISAYLNIWLQAG